MDNTALARVHRAESERHAGRTHTVGGVPRHRAQFGFTHQAKVINVADKTLAMRETARERLIDEMLQSVEEFAAFAAKESGISAVNV